MWSIRPKNVQVGFKTLDLINEFFFYEKMLSSNENVIVFMKNHRLCLCVFYPYQLTSYIFVKETWFGHLLK